MKKIVSIDRLEVFCFVAYLTLCFYFYMSDGFYFILRTRDFFSGVYSIVGFEWSEAGSYYFSLSVVFGVLFNGISRLFKIFKLGWPIYKEHNFGSLIDSFFMFVFYSLIVFFAVGFAGQKYSIEDTRLALILGVFISGYVFGLIVNVLDEFLSAIYVVILRGGK